MARAKTGKWIKLIAGLAVGASASGLFSSVVPVSVSGSALLAAPVPDRPLPVHDALNTAIEMHRRGDYETAAGLFQQVLDRQQDLTDVEKKDFGHFWSDNTLALEARREGSRQLGLIDRAVLENRVGDANELLKKVMPNEQYLAPSDKVRCRDLYSRLKGQPADNLPPMNRPLSTGGVAGGVTFKNDYTTPPAQPAPAPVQQAPLPQQPVGAAPLPSNMQQKAGLSDARAKLQLARAQLNQANIDLAEMLVGETERMGVSFPPAEDSPAKLRQDIVKAKTDPKMLLLAARAAMGRQEFDAAEHYAKQSEALASTFTFALSSDSPSKVLKEVKELKASSTVATVESNKQPVNTPPKPDENTVKARFLLQEGRKALAENKLPLAKQYAEQAKSFRATFDGTEDTPERLLGAISLAEANAPNSRNGKVDPAAVKPDASASKAATTREEALVLLKLAREQLAQGKIEDAQTSAIKARAARNVSWGLFEESPDSLLKEIEKARVKRDQDEAVKVLAEGRKMLDKGDWEGAQKDAYRAQKLHGPYGLLDFGDCPAKLLADAQEVRKKSPPKPDTAVVKKEDKKPDVVAQAPTPKPSPDASLKTVSTLPPLNSPANQDPMAKRQGIQMLAEARVALHGGDIGRAKWLADQVAGMRLTFGPGEDSPELIYHDLGKATLPPVGADHGPTLLPEQPVQAPTPVAQPQQEPTKARAMQLLAEGRQLQKAERLLEARQKCLEALNCGVVFAFNEDSPAQAVNDLTTSAKQRMDKLAAQATELAQYGAGEPLVRYQKAEDMLLEAQTLAKYFAFDSAMIDAKLLWIREVRAQATGQPARVTPDNRTPGVEQVQADPLAGHGVMLPPIGQGTYEPATTKTAYHSSQPAEIQPVTTLPAEPIQSAEPTLTMQPASPKELAEKGQQLLQQARSELRAEALTQARRLAMEAMRDEYGVGVEAVAVLRSIDAEVAVQKSKADRLAFKAVLASYNRKDYTNATLVLNSIDPHNLDPQQTQQMHELMQSPGMTTLQQTSALAQAEPAPTGAGGTPLPTIPGTQGSNDPPARIRVSDQTPTPEQDALNNQLGMRNILFQQLRNDGITARNVAADKFRSGDSDQALSVLQDYLLKLEDVHNLDANKVALLRRPVESQYNQFKLMKMQTDLKDELATSASTKRDHHGKVVAAEELKQKKVADLMKQCNSLIKDRKFDEAYRLALLVKDLDPDNAAVEGLVVMAEMQRNYNTSQVIKKGREEEWLGDMNDVDKPGLPLTNDNPLAINLERLKNSKTRTSLDSLIQHKSPKMLEMEHRLLMPATVSFKDVPLNQAVNSLRQQYLMNFDFDQNSIDSQSIRTDRPVTLQMEGVSLKTVLDLLVNKANLAYVVKDDHIWITTKDNAKGQLERKVFAVTDLIVPVNDSIGEQGMTPGSPMLPYSQGQQTNLQGQPYSQGMQSSIPANPASGYVPTPLSTWGGNTSPGVPTGNGLAYGPPPPSDWDTNPVGPYGNLHMTKRPMRTREDALIKLITNSVQPASWADAGGPGTIDYFPLAGGLVINQTLDILEQVQDLLQALRRLQDQEVAIEVRLITVDEDYYERIGVDFSMDIATNSRNNRNTPALLSGAFAPAGQINSPLGNLGGNGLLAGISPAGTLTPDLSIPIQPNSFSQAVPPFGGYQGSGVGGLSLGLAFLSDIQVSMFLEAVAGDARSSISQSPRITMQNGQQASIFVTENLENLVTNINLTPLQNGNYALIPTITPVQNQVQLQISAVISADRRFVRLAPQLSLTNVSISTPLPNPIPILLPIYPTLSLAEPGQSVVYTEYIQEPQRTSTIFVNTTVTVPDGGTVVMGGLKRMSEGRVEYGPPVLSKIPYIDRLFRNVGYGRTGTSILIMVTPRIIIQEEEEERATGFSIRPAVVN